MARKLYVGSLPYSTTEDELKKLFEEHGTVESAVIIIDKYTNQSKGFGFVEMSSDEEAEAAMKALDGNEVGGRKIVVNPARPPRENAA